MDTAIVMYGTAWCPDCRRARRVFETLGVSYTWVDIDHDAEARARVEALNNGARSVPTIVFPDGDILVEPDNATLTQRLMPYVQSVEG